MRPATYWIMMRCYISYAAHLSPSCSDSRESMLDAVRLPVDVRLQDLLNLGEGLGREVGVREDRELDCKGGSSESQTNIEK